MTPGKDGLDDWLDREVRPLPPPAGTFELITKRARRRKLRKLAVTLTSAAAVAAAAVFAVPTVLALHLSPSPGNGNPIANQSTSPPTPNALTSTPTRTPTPGVTTPPSPSTPATAPTPGSAPGGTAPSGAGVPANFQPTSVTFVSANEGWTIGQAGTPGTCANADPTICTSMARTNDRGKTWTGVPAPSTKLVSGIRFLDGVNGWAFGPQLWSTHDHGNTWTQVDTQGMEVIDLETAGSKAYAVFATCSNNPPNGNVGDPAQPHDCTRFTLEATPSGADNWSPVGSTTTGLTVGANNWVGAYLVLGSGRGWLLGPDDSLYSGSLAGGSWQKIGSTPCQVTKLLTWIKPSGLLVTACNSQAAGGPAGVTVYTSPDDGATWANGGSAPSSGAVTSLSGSPSAPIILATSSGIDVRTSSGQQHQVASLPGGFSYVGMTGDNQGVAVPVNTSLHEIWMTYDGGLQWIARQVSS